MNIKKWPMVIFYLHVCAYYILYNNVVEEITKLIKLTNPKRKITFAVLVLEIKKCTSFFEPNSIANANLNILTEMSNVTSTGTILNQGGPTKSLTI